MKNHLKSIFVPYMGDHSYVAAAALRACGNDAAAIPPTDEETLEIGLHHCRGRECSPCFATTGDCIRLTRHPHFDPAQSVIFFPTNSGPCRFGQYVAFLRDIFDQLGLHQLEIVSPSTKTPFQGFGRDPLRAIQLMWQGVVAVDLLYKLLLEHRPYEKHPGQTDQLYQHCLQHIVDAVDAGGEYRLVQAMYYTAEQFNNLPVDMRIPRPRIGLIGEIYVRFNPRLNLDIIRKIEATGGEVVMSTMTEWVYHMLWGHMRELWADDDYGRWFGLTVGEQYLQNQERRYIRTVARLLKAPYETPMIELMHKLRPWYDVALVDEGVLNISKTIDFFQHGASGIINAMPFSCIPGIITSGIAPRLRREALHNIPWLDVTFDAQAETSLRTRLEAFMHQAGLFQERHYKQRLAS